MIVMIGIDMMIILIDRLIFYMMNIMYNKIDGLWGFIVDSLQLIDIWLYLFDQLLLLFMCIIIIYRIINIYIIIIYCIIIV